ncbi:MAG: class I SAM-dependent methyltransferase, partial [Acidimicrobiales bacterium]
MLTVDFGRLGLVAGERVLDLGCGAGRHAFECLRRGGRVVALDADALEVKSVNVMLAAMQDADEVPG